MSDLLAKAENYERKAEKKLHFFGTEYDEAPVPDFLVAKLSRGGLYGPKFDDAADLFQKAAICFKRAKSWDKAGSTYIRLANCHLKMERKGEAALSYIDAGNCYKETSTKEAITCIEQAVNLFCDIGRLNMAERCSKDIAELYESEQNFEKAISYFEKAADFFQNKKLTTSANECKLKVAQLSAQLEQYPRAIKIYEEIARHSLEIYRERERNSLAWHSFEDNWLEYESSIKGHLLNAGLCQLCKGDPVAITNSLERYQDLYPTFSGTRECRFLTDIATTIDEEDVSQFTDIVKGFDSMTTLDPWKTTLILRVKDKLKAKNLKRPILLESIRTGQACSPELASQPGLGIVASWNDPGLGTIASCAIRSSNIKRWSQACLPELASRPARPGLDTVASWNDHWLGNVSSRAIRACVLILHVVVDEGAARVVQEAAARAMTTDEVQMAGRRLTTRENCDKGELRMQRFSRMEATREATREVTTRGRGRFNKKERGG